MQDEARAPLTATPDDNSTSNPAVARPRRRFLVVLALVIGLVVLVADQASKAWALSALGGGEARALIGDLITLRLLRNPGAAFSIGDTRTWLLTTAAVLVLIGILVAMRRLGSVTWAWALGLLVGGAVGNLIDRFFRPPGPGHGHVVDFIDYFGWFVGNIADVAIVIAAGLIALLAVRGVGVDGRHHPSRGDSRP